MRVVTLTNGVVSEVFEINRPIADFPSLGYIEAGPEVVLGFLHDGTNFTPHPTYQAEIDAKAEAQIQQNTDDILRNDKRFRVMAELIFDTLKAGKTGNYSAFDGVTNKSTFREHVIERFRNL